MANATIPDSDSDKVALSCFDFLLIELVPLAHRLVAELQAKEAALLAHHHSHTSTSSMSTTTTATASPTLARKMTLPDRTSSIAAASSTADSTTTTPAPGGAAHPHTSTDIDDDTRAQIHHRLDALGYRVGQGLTERFSAHTPRANTPLDKIKFICKDLWTLVFRKQIDNLKTNHRGTFVLTDGRFSPLARVSVDRGLGARGLDEAVRGAQGCLWFPCGVLRGALEALGMECTVQGETSDLKSAVFQIRTVGSKA